MPTQRTASLIDRCSSTALGRRSQRTAALCLLTGAAACAGTSISNPPQQLEELQVAVNSHGYALIVPPRADCGPGTVLKAGETNELRVSGSPQTWIRFPKDSASLYRSEDATWLKWWHRTASAKDDIALLLDFLGDKKDDKSKLEAALRAGGVEGYTVTFGDAKVLTLDTMETQKALLKGELMNELLREQLRGGRLVVATDVVRVDSVSVDFFGIGGSEIRLDSLADLFDATFQESKVSMGRLESKHPVYVGARCEGEWELLEDKALLTLTDIPTGATVIVDEVGRPEGAKAQRYMKRDVPAGSRPEFLVDVGKFKVTVVPAPEARFESYYRDVELEERSTRVLRLQTEGRFVLQTEPVGASVTVAGESVGNVSEGLLLSPGKYTATIAAPFHQSRNVDIEVSSATTTDAGRVELPLQEYDLIAQAVRIKNIHVTHPQYVVTTDKDEDGRYRKGFNWKFSGRVLEGSRVVDTDGAEDRQAADFGDMTDVRRAAFNLGANQDVGETGVSFVTQGATLALDATSEASSVVVTMEVKVFNRGKGHNHWVGGPNQKHVTEDETEEARLSREELLRVLGGEAVKKTLAYKVKYKNQEHMDSVQGDFEIVVEFSATRKRD